MGVFNRFIVDERCSACGQIVDNAYQFKFGSRGQYDYQQGDTLQWGANDQGDPGQPDVVVDCLQEGCPNCGFGYDSSDANGFRLRIQNDRVIGVEGPYQFDSLLFGSDLDLRSVKREVEGRRQELGLWTDWDGDEDYSVETHSNSDEWYWLQTNAHGARDYNRVDWTGPAFLRVIHTTRSEELTDLLSGPHLIPLSPGPDRRRSYSGPDDHEFYVDSRVEIDDPSIYRGIAQATNRRVLVYEVGGDTPILEFIPTDSDPRGRTEG